MNFDFGHRFVILFAFVGIIFVFGFQSSVSAGLTAINDSPDEHDEPNLIGINPFPNNLNPSVIETLYGEQNVRRVDDSLDVAFRHTGELATVDAVARFTCCLSSFYYITDGSDQFQQVLRIITSGPSDSEPQGYYPPTFSDLLPETIALADSGSIFEVAIHGTGRSNPAHNNGTGDHMVTFEIIGNDGHPENQIGNIVVAFEGFPANDTDFQDLVFELSGVVPVPEPTASMLLAMALACPLSIWRRRFARP